MLAKPRCRASSELAAPGRDCIHRRDETQPKAGWAEFLDLAARWTHSSWQPPNLDAEFGANFHEGVDMQEVQLETMRGRSLGQEVAHKEMQKGA
eukprot:1159274-Pelagomonas_calceolata.AAC.5